MLTWLLVDTQSLKSLLIGISDLAKEIDPKVHILAAIDQEGTILDSWECEEEEL